MRLRKTLTRLLTALLVGLLVVALLIFAGEERWRSQERRRLIAQLEEQYPSISTYLEYSDSKWVPYPWEPSAKKTDALLSRIVTAAIARLEGLDKRARPWFEFGDEFTWYFQLWSVNIALCDFLAFRKAPVPVECTRPEVSKLGASWREVLLTNYADDYVDSSGPIPRLRRRPRSFEKLCNLSPINAFVERVEHIASSATVSFYSLHLDTEIGTHRFPRARHMRPGECETLIIKGFDREPNERNVFYLAAFDHLSEAWFRRIWTRYHFPELGNPAYLGMLSRESRKKIENEGKYFCLVKKEWSNSKRDCDKKEQPRPFLPSLVLHDGSNLLVIEYPFFADTAMILATNGAHINEKALEHAQSDAAHISKLSWAEMELEAKWASRIPRFMLTDNDLSNVSDPDGPFQSGVLVKNIPSQTILGENTAIPPSGVVLQINSVRSRAGAPVVVTTPIRSIYGLLEAIESHGSSREAGIKALLRIALGNPVSGDGGVYETRFRFNPFTAQDFDTDTGFGAVAWAGLKTGATAGLLSDWTEEQRYAYMMQMRPDLFNGSEFFGGVLPFVGARYLGKMFLPNAFRTGVAGLVAFGAIEGGVSYAYARATASSLQTKEEIHERAKLQAKVGFAFGAFFSPGR